jgi:hypothetical protein
MAQLSVCSQGQEVQMSCKWCRSNNQVSFHSEINIHFPGFDNLTKPTVWAFPELVICLDCGFAETRIEAEELRLIAEGCVEENGDTNGDISRYKHSSSKAA